ncbi:MAG: MFS transporter [Candidatus Lokiarchaeota archaeon]|nr:MFS transporter [Candidatus Lokiarchaeota archaeon]
MNTSPAERVSWKETVGYALSSVPGGIFVSMLGFLQAFWYGWMGLDPSWIAVAQVVYAVWNVLNDPIFGMLMDRTRTKSGRYIPWIKVCAPLFSASFVLVFFPPAGWGLSTGGVDYQFPLFVWYLVSQLCYDTCFTICYLACTALFPQITIDGRERTKIALASAGLSIAGAAAGLVPMALLSNPSPESVAAFQVCVLVFGAVSFVPWAFFTRWVKERQEYIPPTQASFRQSARTVLANRAGQAFIAYEGLSTGAMYFVQTGFAFVIAWIFGFNDSNPGSTFWDAVPFLLGPAGGIVAGTVIILYIPRYRDLKAAITFSLAIQSVGYAIAFAAAYVPNGTMVGAYSLPPGAWLVSLGFSVGAMGMPAFLIYLAPARAMVVDYDESITGERREAVYSGLGCIASKPMTSLALAAVPFILASFSLVPANDIDFTNGLVVEGDDFGRAITGVAVATFLIPAILSAIGVAAWHFFPIDRNNYPAIKAKLERLHGDKRSERLDGSGRSKFLADS